MSGVTLDAGALIAVERGSRRMIALFQRALDNGCELAVPAGVVAQTWRGGAKQARLARLLASAVVCVVSLEGITARAVGVLCGRTGGTDIVDVSVVLCARERGHAVVTSDPGDLRAIDPRLTLLEP